jgi:hypothetical protein
LLQRWDADIADQTADGVHDAIRSLHD